MTAVSAERTCGHASPLGAVLDGTELTALQREAACQITFSLTLACPLRCAHCLVATRPVAELPAVTVDLDQARQYAEDFPVLVREGVERVSITGGEPLLAPQALSILSEAAQAAGLACTVVTACHWARSDRVAAATIASFPAIDRWHLSTDRYHLNFLSLDHVIRAARAASAARRDVVVRMAAPSPLAPEDRALAERLARQLPDGAHLAIQPVSAVGRAATLGLQAPPRRDVERAWTPCMSTGLMVRHDGEIRPCCSSLADVMTAHGFARANARDGLAEAYRRWRDDPLLQLVRAVGFGPVVDWIRADCEPGFGADLPAHPCDQCMACWSVPGAREAVGRRIARAEVAQKIGELHDRVFDKPGLQEATT